MGKNNYITYISQLIVRTTGTRTNNTISGFSQKNAVKKTICWLRLAFSHRACHGVILPVLHNPGTDCGGTTEINSLQKEHQLVDSAILSSHFEVTHWVGIKP